MDLFITVYLDLIVLSFFTGLIVTSIKRRDDKRRIKMAEKEAETTFQRNLELFGGVEPDQVQNLINISTDETEYDVPVIYAVVDVQDTADGKRV